MATNRDVRTRFIGQDSTGQAARSASRNVRSVGGAYDSLANSVAKTNRVIAAATLGVSGSSVVKTASDLQNVTLRLSRNSQNLARDQLFLGRTSQRLSVDIENLTDAFARLRTLEGAGALERGQSEAFVEGLADVFAAFGANTGRQENVIYGISQALGQGTVQAQELNQVIEPLPGLLNVLARNAGTTSQGYRQLVKDGKLLSSVFRSDLIEAFKEYEGASEAAAGNIQQTLTRLSNEYKAALVELSVPLTSGIAAGSDVLISAIRTITDNIGKIVFAAKVLGTVLLAQFGARQLGRIGEYTSGFVANAKKRIEASEAETAAYAQKAARERFLIARSILDRERLAEAEAKVKILDTSKDIGAQASKVDLAAQARAKKEELVQERELIATRAKGAADAAEANKVRLEGEQQRLTSLKRTQEASLVLQRDEALAATQSKELAKTRRELAKVEKDLDTARRASAGSAARSLKAQEKLAAASEKARNARDKEYAVRQRTVQLNALQLSQQNEINAATARRAAAINKVQGAAGKLKAAIEGTTRAMGLQLAASRALAGGLSLLRGAFALIGGPAGAAVLAGVAILGFRQAAASAAEASVLGKLKQEVEDLEEELKLLGVAAKNSQTEITEATRRLAEIEALEARVAAGGFKQMAKDIAGAIGKLDPATRLLEKLLGVNLFETTDELKEQAQAIRDYSERVEGLKGEISDLEGNLDRATSSAERLRQALTGGAIEFAETITPAVTKTEELQKKLDRVKTALSGLGQFSNEDRAHLERAKKELEEQIDKEAGGPARRAEAERKITKAQADQLELRRSLLNEEQKAIAEANDKIIALRERASIKGPAGAPLVSQAEVKDLSGQIIEQRNAELIDLAEKRREREIQLARDAANEIERIEQQAHDRQISARNELIGALAVINPIDGIKAANDAIITDLERRATKELSVAENLELLKLAAVIEGEKRIQAARDQIADDAAQARAKAQLVNEVDVSAGLLGSLLDVAQKEAGQYIEITKKMTDEERASAERSNAINKARFEKNKKYRIAQAIIDTFAGANRAIAEGGFIGLTQALTVIATGLANVQKIKAQSFGGSGAAAAASVGSTAGGSSRLGDGDQLGSTTAVEPVRVTQFIITGDESLVNRDRFAKYAVDAVTNASADRTVLVSGDGRILPNREAA